MQKMKRDNAKLKYVSFNWCKVVFFWVFVRAVLEFRKVWV